MDHDQDDAGIKEGDLLAGKYRIERVLGRGGMGVVVAARHVELDERVAIKFLLPETLDNPEAVARFSREARAAVRIKSERVARIIDVGRLENGAPYIIMEYLEGRDLAGWLEHGGPLPLDRALDFVLQASEAVAAAHVLGIVHRDLKPANLFVITQGDGTSAVKVLDFGISKVQAPGDDAATITHPAALLGSPLYMPPEQLRSARDVDPRSDIWSLGVILHELISGAPPFTGTTMPEVLTQVLEGSPPPLRRLMPDVPEGVERVVLTCLQKDKARRYADVGEFATALQPFAPERCKLSVERITGVLRGMRPDLAAPPSFNEPGPLFLPGAATRASWGGTKAGRHRSQRYLALGAGALLSVGAILSLLWWSRSGATGAPLPTGAASDGAAPPGHSAAPRPREADLGRAGEPKVEPMAAKPTSAASTTAGPLAGRNPIRGGAKRANVEASSAAPSPATPPPAPRRTDAADPFADR